MTDINTQGPNIPTTPEYQFAYVLATIHSTYLKGDMDRVHALLANLPIALADPDVRRIYESAEVDQYLDWAYPFLFGEDEVVDEQEEFDVIQFIQDMIAAVEAEDALEAEDATTGWECDDPECNCHDEDEDDWEEVIAETDEFLIVKIKK